MSRCSSCADQPDQVVLVRIRIDMDRDKQPADAGATNGPPPFLPVDDGIQDKSYVRIIPYARGRLECDAMPEPVRPRLLQVPFEFHHSITEYVRTKMYGQPYTNRRPASSITEPMSAPSSGRIISLCALPEGIIGRQFSFFSTRQSKTTGRGLSIISRIFASSSEEHTSELQSQSNLVCRLLL